MAYLCLIMLTAPCHTVRLRMIMAERIWQNLLAGIHAPALDYRKPLLIYWFMSHVIKYVRSRCYTDSLC